MAGAGACFYPFSPRHLLVELVLDVGRRLRASGNHGNSRVAKTIPEPPVIVGLLRRL